MLGLTRQGCHKAVSALLQLFLSQVPRFVSNRVYLRSFLMESRASHEFERTRGMITAIIEGNVSRHPTELVCLNARSYRIMYLR
ncbi:hypothetical protein TNCV_698681 [Trichonephila clavipes]|nr:hypothetical protein TNCV_698681 [Trichonephila clavipes]